MDQTFKPSDFVIPPTSFAVLLPSSRQPSFVQNSTKFQRAAYDPTRKLLVTERFDPKDEPYVFNYNAYPVVATSSGALLSGPSPTATTFIPHHSLGPSTWFNSRPYV